MVGVAPVAVPIIGGNRPPAPDDRLADTQREGQRMTETPPQQPTDHRDPANAASGAGTDDPSERSIDPGRLLGDLQQFAASDAAVLDSIGRLLDDLQAAAAALPTPDVDTDALWARVELRAWGTG